MTADEWIQQFHLVSHPEGGWYGEVYRSSGEAAFEGFEGSRNYLTSIYFLLEKGRFSALHRIKSDELWYFHAGGPLEILEIDEAGRVHLTQLGSEPGTGQVLSHVVRAGRWFGSRPQAASDFSLVSCAVAPGFDFRDFEMPDREWFLKTFPNQAEILVDWTR